MSDTSTEAIAALMDGVTPPPWRAGAHRWPEQVGCCPLVGRPFSAHRHLLNVAAANTEADIRFIAAARDLVPALAAERDALRAALEIAANRLQLCAVDFDAGSHESIEASEWAKEARAALKGAAND